MDQSFQVYSMTYSLVRWTRPLEGVEGHNCIRNGLTTWPFLPLSGPTCKCQNGRVVSGLVGRSRRQVPFIRPFCKMHMTTLQIRMKLCYLMECGK